MERNLQLIKPENLLPTPFGESGFVIEHDCDICEDYGFVIRTRQYGEKKYSGAEKCVCMLVKARKQKLAKIPPQFRNANLATLKADPGIHKGQVEAVAKMKANPDKNYFLAGTFGTGKTLFMWALYHHAAMADRLVYYSTLTGLLNEYKGFIQNPENGFPYLTADRLQTRERFSVFIDDVDKARPTEYAAEQFFEVVNTIYEQKHQLVVSTNLSFADLVRHFERVGDKNDDPILKRYGGAICRRLAENAEIIEMF